MKRKTELFGGVAGVSAIAILFAMLSSHQTSVEEEAPLSTIDIIRNNTGLTMAGDKGLAIEPVQGNLIVYSSDWRPGEELRISYSWSNGTIHVAHADETGDYYLIRANGSFPPENATIIIIGLESGKQIRVEY